MTTDIYTYMAIITRKIEVYLHKTGDKTIDDDRRLAWYTINDNLYKAANRIVSHKFFNDEYEHRLQIQSPEFQSIQKQLKTAKRDKLTESDVTELKRQRKILFDKFKAQTVYFLRGGGDKGSVQNITYKVASNEFLEFIPGDILTCLNQNISKTYSEYKSDIAQGDRAISNYKRNMPVPFSIKSSGKLNVIRRDDGTIYVSLPKGLEFDLVFGRDRSNNREIVERVLNGTYKACNSSIQTKNSKTFLLLVVHIPNSNNKLDINRVVGVDLGINIPLYAAVGDNEYEGLSIGSREQFIKVRERMYAQKRELQRSLRNSTNGGRGRTHKLQALERFNEKERNWVHLQNHIFSKVIVEYTLKQRAGVIQIEDLKGFGHDKDDNLADGFKYLVRYWSYFELQSMIKDKAKAVGIEVRHINPYHTSQTCSFCGHWEKGQRINQSTFICKNPDCIKGKGKHKSDGSFAGINADWNAARNIAKSTDYTTRNK